MKIDKAARDFMEVFGHRPELCANVNKFLKAAIINFGDERGDIIVTNDNFRTRRKYADFTNGKKAAGLHPSQMIFSTVGIARACKDRYVGRDNQIHTFGVDDDFGEV